MLALDLPFTRTADIRGRIRCPHLLELYEYWARMADGGRLPQRRRFDPLELSGPVWPRLFLIETASRPEECRVRVLGTYLVGAYGREFTGCRCTDAEIPRFSKSTTYRLLRDILHEKTPQYAYAETQFRFNDDYRHCEQVLLPLADDHGGLAAAVGAIDFPGLRSGCF
ncbi:MAG: PAS domain-containing protein [Rhodospirillales bacterium]|nr:PAS domain-containing protein [Rhodospirillales bacterium]